jgi:hypothetical protein
VGRLLHVEPCPLCHYHVEGPLHFGGSTRSHLFIHHQYQVACCHHCRNLVSVLVPTPDYDLPHVLAAAQADIQALEKRAAGGDVSARLLLLLHRTALDGDHGDDLTETLVCTVCGSGDLAVYTHVGGDEGERFDEGLAWVDCPRCEEGKLLLYTVGTWDEIDDAP